MNDLDQLREMRTEIPAPTRAELAPGRARLLTSISRPPHAHHRRAFLSAGIIATVAAVAVVAILVAAPGSPGPKAPAVGSTAATPTTRFALAARVLGDASATVASRPVAHIGPHQWIYEKSVSYNFGQGTSTDEYWIQFDGSHSAYIDESGKLLLHTAPQPAGGGATALDRYDANTTLMTASDALASLPSGSAAMLALVDKHVGSAGAGSTIWLTPPGGHHTPTRSESEFAYLAQLLWNAYADAAPAAEAAVYRAMGTIPNVGVQSGITDVVGRPAIGVSADGGATQLLLDPHSYVVIGMRGVSNGTNPTGKGSWPAKGQVYTSLAWTHMATVSEPGRR